MIRPLNRKDKFNFLDYCFFNEVPNSKILFNKILKWGTICYIAETTKIVGLLLVEKKDEKKLISIYAEDTRIALDLIKQLIWNSKGTLYAQLKPNSKFVKVFRRLGFRIYSERNNSTIDLVREFNKKYYFKKGKNDGKY